MGGKPRKEEVNIPKKSSWKWASWRNRPAREITEIKMLIKWGEAATETRGGGGSFSRNIEKKNLEKSKREKESYGPFLVLSLIVVPLYLEKAICMSSLFIFVILFF